MRPRLLFVTGALLVAALFPAGRAAAANPQTAGLQVALRAYGLYTGRIDAIAGPETATATRIFQQRHGLFPDGLAGRKTRAAMGVLGRPLFGRRQMKRGDFGWDVSVLQYLLRVPAVDGFYGPETAAAVARWQRKLGLAADGVTGPRSIAVLARRRAVPLAQPQRSLALESPTVIRGSLERWAAVYRLEPQLVKALAWMESGYNPNLTSSTGAWGVMQIQPATWTYAETVLLGRQVPRTADGNVHIGTAYLHHLLNLFHGDEHYALAAWYQGARAVRKHGLYPETQTFVADVIALKSRSL
jgi:peptidoglycan hydrolase-like protein with peptidoglycan-binding domain